MSQHELLLRTVEHIANYRASLGEARVGPVTPFESLVAGFDVALPFGDVALVGPDLFGEDGLNARGELQWLKQGGASTSGCA